MKGETSKSTLTIGLYRVFAVALAVCLIGLALALESGSSRSGPVYGAQPGQNSPDKLH